MSSSRRHFLKLVAGASAFSLIPVSGQARHRSLTWFNVQDWGIEGKGWTDTTRYFSRLPARAEGVVREPVWNLSQHAAGMVVRFITDSPAIHVKYALLSENLAMPHMPATGVSGLDLYARDDEDIDRWCAVVRPTEQEIEKPIAEQLREGRRLYTIYLPLYNGVESLELAVEDGAFFEPVAPRTERPILFYGTSIMHGACASRPGMAIPAILGRRLKRPTINLGFSGNGRMEPEVGVLLAELDPCVFAIDCLPNMNQDMIRERATPLVRQLRAKHADTPILLVEDRSFTNTRFFPERKDRHQTNRIALRETYEALRREGVDHLYYLQGDELLGRDGEAATDGSHPNDLGMVRYADAYEPALRALLSQY